MVTIAIKPKVRQDIDNDFVHDIAGKNREGIAS
jgi:hypothetical protein